MVTIPNQLRSLFTATIDREEEEETYTIEVPASEIEHEALDTGEIYRVGFFLSSATGETDSAQRRTKPEKSQEASQVPEPPVEEGEIRSVSIEAIGDQGDGIAKIERGYVVIVPEAEPGDTPTIEIENVRQNVAFATIVER